MLICLFYKSTGLIHHYTYYKDKYRITWYYKLKKASLVEKQKFIAVFKIQRIPPAEQIRIGRPGVDFAFAAYTLRLEYLADHQIIRHFFPF